MDAITSAIIDDDVEAVERMLADQPELSSYLIQSPRLHTTGIFHWIYVGDTWLHLAAAGHRVEIVKLLLKSGLIRTPHGIVARALPCIMPRMVSSWDLRGMKDGRCKL